MAETQTWTQHFGISQQLLQQWQAGGGTTPFLSWCLQTGAINEAQYMQWAACHYKLPIVKDSFFALPVAEQNFATAKLLFQWTSDILPLEDWDGIVRVACSEPPTQFQLSQPHTFVLASPRQLQILWHRLFPQAPVAVVAPVAAPVVAPTPPPVDEFDPAAMMAAFNAHADGVEATESAEPQFDEHGEPIAPAAEAEAPVMPEGFVFAPADIEIPMPSFGGAKLAAKTAEPVSTPAPIVAAAALEDSVAEFAAPTLLSDELTPLPDGFVMPTVEAAAPTIEPVVAAAPPAAQAGEFATSALPAAPSDFDLCGSIEEVVACAFAKMSSHFQYQLALLPAGETLTPWLWSGKFVRENSAERPAAVDLVTPSLFRIVMRTSMPYHGLTRPSEVNDKFFKEWTQGTALPQVTVVPVMIDDHAALLLFGGMENVIEPRAALSDMEHWARSAALACRRISEKAASVAA